MRNKATLYHKPSQDRGSMNKGTSDKVLLDFKQLMSDLKMDTETATILHKHVT
jgi:hypothetical protein